MRLKTLFLESKKKHHVGVFVRLPSELGKEFPDLAEDDSPAHVTTLYVGDQSPSVEEDMVAAVREVALETEPFEILYSGLGYFNHDDKDETVAYVKVRSDGLRILRTRLSRALKKYGVEWEDKWGKFKPHITLAYMDFGSKYTGNIPDGKWTCNSVEIWGFDTKHTVKFAAGG